jgi:hypothetical protein
MDEIKRQLIERDKEKSVVALTEYIHYTIAPNLQNIAPAVIFECRSDVEVFCRERQIELYAFDWLTKELRGGHLLGQTDIPVTLSRAGVERYCKNF